MTANPYNTLALDTALRTGYAHSSGYSGVWRLGSPGDKSGHPMARLEELILEAHANWGVERLVFEAAAYGGKYLATKQFHNACRGVMIACAAKLNIAWAEYHPSSIKAFAGHGRFQKWQMVRALHMHYPELSGVTDDNEADAWWILKLDQHTLANPLAKLYAEAKKKRPRRKKIKQQRFF